MEENKYEITAKSADEFLSIQNTINEFSKVMIASVKRAYKNIHFVHIELKEQWSGDLDIHLPDDFTSITEEKGIINVFCPGAVISAKKQENQKVNYQYSKNRKK